MQLTFLPIALLSLFLTLSPLTTAVPLHPRDAPEVLTSIHTLNTTISRFRPLIAAYNASAAANPIITLYHTLRADLATTTSLTTDSPEFSPSESYAVADALDELVPGVTTLLQDVIDKASWLKSKAGPQVHDALADLAEGTAEMFSAVERTVVLAAVGAVTASEEPISAAFRDAVEAYA